MSQPSGALHGAPARVALAALFLIAHLVSLPPALEDIDSINFALGVRDFDVARHQPHPPGYPLFIALAKLSTPVMRAIGVPSPEVRGLAVWSALGGAALCLLIYGLWRALDGNAYRAALAAMITAACPLFWFTSLRPLSDVAGLAVTVAALLLLTRALPAAWTSRSESSSSTRSLLAGAALAGLAIGFRSQAAILTCPLLALVLIAPGGRAPLKHRAAALAAAILGVALWAIPLVVASGGPSAYVTALGSQAGEDFSGVVMLWTNRTVRVAMVVVFNTFVLPWDSAALAGVMLAIAGGGLLVLIARAPRHLALLAVMFGPYAVFHLLFQETVTTRYALPLVLPLVYLVAVTLTESRPIASAPAAAALVVTGLWFAVPAGLAYGRTPSPMVRAFSDMRAAVPPASLIGMHRRVWTESRRTRLWEGEPPGQLLAAPRDYEWLELTRAWRTNDAARTMFLADPRRIDLAVIDPVSSRTTRYRWPFKKTTYVGGTRPDEVDLVTLTPPGWFLERGWALSPEVAGITDRDGWGPQRQPSQGWIRRRGGETVMMIGGRHLGATDGPPVRIHVAIDAREILTFDTGPGFFLRFHPLDAGTLAGAGPFAHLTVTADRPAPGPVPAVAIEQFDLQAPDAVQFGYDAGWQEPEYNAQTGRSWRWMSERATLMVRSPAGRDVILRIAGESSLRYYDRAAKLTVSVADRAMAVLEPGRDFSDEVRVPAAALAAGNGRITLTSDQMLIPGDREGTNDRRHLALRIYSVAVEVR